MLNKAILMGRLTRDPELRHTPSNMAVTSFTLAIDRDRKGQSGERQTDFIDVVAWRHTAEFVNKYFHKGSMMVVSGRLQMRDWTDKDGNKRTSAEVVADNVYFGDSNRGGDSNRDSGYSGNSYGGGNSYSGGGSSYGGRESGGYGGGSYGSGRDSSRSAQQSAPSGFSELDDGDGELPF